MTAPSPAPSDPAPAGRARRRSVLSRRNLILGSAVAALGLGGGVGYTGYRWAQANRERLGAMVGAPVDAADVARWRADIDTLAAHGQNLVRTGVYAWKLAPEKGRWDAAEADFYREQLEYAQERGMQINLVLPGTPDWAQSYTFDEYRKTCTWFWTQAQGAFGDLVDLWQAFNEADHAHFQRFTPAKRNAAYLGQFAELLAVARDTLGRGRTPVTTNLTGWPMNDEREQEWYLVLDAISPSLDLISIDLYPADDETEIARLAERMRRVRERYGRPIFVAEIGLQTTPGSWTEPDQQRYVAAAIEQLRTVDLWGICLYELRDNTSEVAFGIQKADGSPKLGFSDVMRAMSPR